MEDEKKQEQEKPKLFDATGPFRLKTPTPEGIKVIEIRFPSDEDWLDRETRRRDIITIDGLGQTKTVREDPDEAEVELVKRLCPEFAEADPFEAGRLIDRLSTAKTIDGSVSGPKVKVSVLVYPGIRTLHTFRIPTSKERQKFDRDWVSQQPLGRKSYSSVRDLRLLQKLYDGMREQVDGYAAGVPIIHQAEAVIGAFMTLDAELDSQEDPPVRSGR